MRGQIVPASRSRSGGLPLGRLTLLALVIGTRLAADEGASPVDIDEVMCALCHFEQGDEFVESIHYQKGLLLCDDCHGGDPFAAEIEKAKAPETGFIGKPRRSPPYAAGATRARPASSGWDPIAPGSMPTTPPASPVTTITACSTPPSP